MIFFLWFAHRLRDARCVFFHTNQRGKQFRYYFFSKVLFQSFSLLLVASLLALPLTLFLEVIPNVKYDLEINLLNSNTTNYNNVSDQFLQGSFATVRIFQVVTDYMFSFALIFSFYFTIENFRKAHSAIKLRFFRASVMKVLLKGFADEDSSPSIENVSVIFED